MGEGRGIYSVAMFQKIRDTRKRVSYFLGSLISFVHPKGN